MGQVHEIIDLGDSSDDDISTYNTNITALNMPLRRPANLAPSKERLKQPFETRRERVVIVIDSEEEEASQKKLEPKMKQTKPVLSAQQINGDTPKVEAETPIAKERKPIVHDATNSSSPMADLNSNLPTGSVKPSKQIRREKTAKEFEENRTPSPASITSSTSGTSNASTITRRILPVRQTRTKVVIYDDIINASEDFTPERSFIDYYKRAAVEHRSGAVSKRAKISNIGNLPPAGSRPPKEYSVSYPSHTGFTYDISMQRHFSLVRSEDHPENPWRTFKVFNIFEYHGLVQHCERILGRRATRDEILLAHNIYHYRKMRDTVWLENRTQYIIAQKEYESIYFNCNTYDSALMAAGSLIEVTKAVIQRKVKNAFAIIRPPGHHATFDIAKGFCIFNNVAVASKNLIKHHGVKKILIVDWDIHFGNGTQNIFTEDPSVLYMSLHRYEDSFFYPQDTRGAAEYTGHGAGEGTTVNIPWPCAGMTDADYIYAFKNVVIPIATEFNPDIVIVSAGFDAAVNDPIGQCFLTPAAYGQMTHMLKNIADGKVVLALEGGYDLNSIALSAYECMQVLMGARPDPIDSNLTPQKGCIEAIELVKRVQRKYWRCLQDSNYQWA